MCRTLHQLAWRTFADCSANFKLIIFVSEQAPRRILFGTRLAFPRKRPTSYGYGGWLLSPVRGMHFSNSASGIRPLALPPSGVVSEWPVTRARSPSLAAPGAQHSVSERECKGKLGAYAADRKAYRFPLLPDHTFCVHKKPEIDILPLCKFKLLNHTRLPRAKTAAASLDACFVWCLWCLFGAEIGATYAELLKELKQAKP